MGKLTGVFTVVALLYNLLLLPQAHAFSPPVCHNSNHRLRPVRVTNVALRSSSLASDSPLLPPLPSVPTSSPSDPTTTYLTSIEVLPAPTYSNLARFAIPLSMMFIVNFAMGTIDTVSVAKYGGVVQLGALAPATAAIDYLSYIFSFLSTSSLTLMSATYSSSSSPSSAKPSSKKRSLFSVAVRLCFLAGMFQGVFTLAFASPVAAALGARGSLLLPATQYLAIRSVGVPIFQLLNAGAAACFAAEDSATPFFAGIAQGFVNFVGNAVLCPRMESPIAGAAIATVFSQAVVCAALYLRLYFKGEWGSYNSPPSSSSASFSSRVKSIVPPYKASKPFFAFYKLTGIAIARLGVYALVTRLCCQVGPVSAAAAQVRVARPSSFSSAAFPFDKDSHRVQLALPGWQIPSPIPQSSPWSSK